MRRYRLGVGDREFVVDVQELAADRFDVVVGEQRYEVTLTGDEELATPIITPSLPALGSDAGSGSTPSAVAAAAGRRRTEPATARAPAAQPASARRGGGAAALGAPMPGVILEIHVKAGDTVQRGQQIAVLDAMKMHNIIGAPRAGTIVEVCVVAGQSVGHGEPIVRFAEG
jgi:glutaconyl-CoA/methylmalonyl-CoA decarboxylase subunit gamma